MKRAAVSLLELVVFSFFAAMAVTSALYVAVHARDNLHKHLAISTILHLQNTLYALGGHDFAIPQNLVVRQVYDPILGPITETSLQNNPVPLSSLLPPQNHFGLSHLPPMATAEFHQNKNVLAVVWEEEPHNRCVALARHFTNTLSPDVSYTQNEYFGLYEQHYSKKRLRVHCIPPSYDPPTKILMQDSKMKILFTDISAEYVPP